jgi:transposase
MNDVLEAQEKETGMEKISTVQALGNEIFKEQKLTIGVDLGDRWSFYCVLEEAGKIILEQKVPTTPEAMKQTFSRIPQSRIALETGTHSPWVSRLLTELEHEVIVAHAQKVQLITKSNRKDDRHDARTLARLARIDPELLGPVRHRSVQAQIHLTVIRARAELVSARTALVNAARGLVKSYGERLPKCGTQQVSRELAAALSAELRDVLEPLFTEIESLNERIKEYDERMEKIAKEVYPEVSLLKQVKGVGTQIALTYVLTIEDPHRFLKSREVGCFLGLKPGRRNSGESEPQKKISKAGDRYLRTMMVQGAHYILGPFGEDSDLRRWGRKLAERGGKNAKKRAVVAVARKLAVLLHRLWVSGEVYEPLRNRKKRCGQWPREFRSEQLSSTAESR